MILANKRAKRLRELLDRQRSAKERSIPFVRPLVFCSAPDLVCHLSDHARQGVYLRDREASPERGPRRGIVWALTAAEGDELAHPEAPPAVDPSEARRGDQIAPGIFVEQRLGRGSTATVFVALGLPARRACRADEWARAASVRAVAR